MLHSHSLPLKPPHPHDCACVKCEKTEASSSSQDPVRSVRPLADNFYRPNTSAAPRPADPPLDPPTVVHLNHEHDWWVRILLMAILFFLVMIFTTQLAHGQSPTSAEVFYYSPSAGKWIAVSSSNPLPVLATVSGSNPCASATGSAVPADACWGGLNISGNLAGWTGFTVGSQNAAAVAIVDGSGNQITSFGGGTQYTQGTTQASPVGTVAMGINPSNVINALNQDASGNLNVNLNANSFGTITVAGSTNVFKVSPTTSANSASNPFFDQLTDGTNAIGAFANYGTSPGAVKVPGVNAYITNTPAVSGSGVFEVGPTTSANTSTNPFFFEQTDGTNHVGAFANYGTSPGAVKVPGINAYVTNTVPVTGSGTAGSPGTDVYSVQGVSGMTPLVTNPTPSSASSVAVSPCNILSTASTNATNCKSSAGNFFGFDVYNTTTTVYYLRLYNTSSSPTCSSATGFIRSVPVPPGASSGLVGGIVENQAYPTNYSTGISYCITGGSGSTDNTNAAAGIFGEIRYD